MAYNVANPPVKLSEGPLTSFGATEAGAGNFGGALWMYKSTDADATVRAAGYFTNGVALGMQVGDIVYVHVTNAAPYAVYLHVVTTISAAGVVTLSSTTVPLID